MNKRFYELFYEGPDAGGGTGGTAAGNGAAAGSAGAGAASGSGPAGGGGGSGSLLAGGGSAAGGNGQASGDGQAAAGVSGNGQHVADQAAGASPYYVGLYDSTGKIDKTKLENLPPELKPYKDSIGKYETFDQFMRGHVNLHQLAGRKGLQPLPPDATPEAKAERLALMRQVNGVPEKPEGYGVTKPEGVPDEMWNGDYVKGVTEIAHKHGISPEAMKELVAFDTKFAGELRGKGDAAQMQTRQQEATALKEAFGGEYAQKTELASRAIRSVGLDPNDAIFGNAKLVIAMSKVGEMISEDRLVSGDSPGNTGQNDRQKAQDIVMNKANPLHEAYHNAEHPQHAAAVEAHSRFNARFHATKKKN
jgi:hypothetical protein